MRDMRAHGIDMLTLGQYLQPSAGHLPVLRYVHPDAFAAFEREAYAMGFRHAAVGALVRSSYHADKQAEDVLGRWRPDVDRRAGGEFGRREQASPAV